MKKLARSKTRSLARNVSGDEATLVFDAETVKVWLHDSRTARYL